MDRDARAKLVRRVGRMFEAGQLPIVELEAYLDGNDVDSSLGRGMRRDFDIAAYARVLRALAARPDVSHVFVEVLELPDIDDEADDDLWAQANIVFVVTSAPTAAIAEETASLNPRAIDEGWCLRPGVPLPNVALKPGYRPLRLDL